MDTKKFAKPKRIDFYTTMELTIPSDDFETSSEVKEMSILYEIDKIEDENNLDYNKISLIIYQKINGLTKALIDDLIDNYEHISCRVSKLSRLAEKTNRTFKSIIGFYLRNKELSDILNRNRACKKLKGYEAKREFTFNELRNLLSCIIKTDDKFHIIKELSTPEKRNDFTKILDEYIIDRNSYTHGYLFFLYPDFKPILEVRPPNEQLHFIMIDDNTITDYMMTHKEISKVLKKITAIVQGFDLKN